MITDTPAPPPPLPPAKARSFLPKDETVQERLESLRATSGFDYLRLLLALLVMLVHSFCVSYGQIWENHHLWLGPLGGPVRSILCVFFALSGFLVSGSIFRSGSISGFVALRMIRILPALTIEVLISAIVLGACVTLYPVSTYYHSHEFWKYFLNPLGEIQFTLPGVFYTVPLANTVNSSLWTITSERNCYFILILLMTMRLIEKRAAVFYLALYCSLAFYLQHEDHMDHRFVETGAVDSDALTTCFLWGVTIYLYGEKVRLNGWLAAASMCAGWLMLYNKHMAYLAAPFMAYSTIWLGTRNPRKLPLIFTGDYSYGVYLYSFPLQQALTLFLPCWRFWWANLLLAVPIAGFIAFVSWHGLEKHVLSHKRAVTGKDSAIARAERATAAKIRNIAVFIYRKATRPQQSILSKPGSPGAEG